MSVLWLVESSEHENFRLIDSLAKNFAVRIIVRSSFQEALIKAPTPHVVLSMSASVDDHELENFLTRSQQQFPTSFFVFLSSQEGPCNDAKASLQQRIYTLQNPTGEDLLILLEQLFDFRKEDQSVHYHGLRLNMETLECWLTQGSQPVPLSFKEAKLLRFFMQSAGISLSRNDILSKVWENVRVSPRTIDCHISRLRKKLVDAPIRIESIYGGGYIFS